ncbi:MAG: LCP family protein [Lachnospiraceae bacterium]|nr:LCP family protein [Lachnospiraceae bacterium]
MSERKRKKLILLIVLIVMALAMTILVLVLSTLDKKADNEAIAQAKQKEQQKKQSTQGNADQEPEREIEGTLVFGDTEYNYYDSLETYLVIGTDGSGNDAEDPEEYKGDMADFLVLLVIDKTAQTYSAVQINRDTMMEVPIVNADGSAHASADQQICTAHWYGGNAQMGDENTVNCVSTLLGGIEINGYYTMNMDHIKELNHAVGGVDVIIEDDFSQDDPSLVMGETIHLTDEQAVSFIRGRMTVGDGQNTSRMRRQSVYMNAFYEKVKQMTHEDPAFINNLYKDMMSLASTNMNGNDVSRITNSILTFAGKGLKTIEGKQELGKVASDLEDHVMFYADETSIISVMTEVCSLEKGDKIESSDEDDADDEEDEDEEDVEEDEEE